MDEFSTVQQHVQAALVATTRSASALANEDLPFHRSLSTSLSAQLDRQNARLLALASTLLGAATPASESVRAAPSLKDLDSVDGNWRVVVDVVDSLLERADTALDEFTGAVRRLTPDAEARAMAATKSAKTSEIARRLRSQDMEKPQLLFENVPTNREKAPFKPLLLSKPHAAVPLATAPITSKSFPKPQYPHPYQLEIEQYQYPASVYAQADPIAYHPFDSTSATFVDTEEAVDEMLEELKLAKEIAIDLEHHDTRSYIGIVCLMQISTRDRDWIVDTLKPWRRKLECLNQVFADPSIVKVLHGAYMDIMWLQRDLGLYIVGLFDTHYAARALGYPGGSLAFLLKKFINIDANKQYQMSDWRIRPLPQELLDYARSDTHYLLYIFDCMRNELIQRSNLSLPNQEGDKIANVLYKSSETALQRYEHPTYDYELGQGPSGWYKTLARASAMFTNEQFAVFKAVHQWRDEVARDEDDSVHYVMPNYHIFNIARELPVTRATLLNVVHPGTPAIRLRADELVGVIIGAKEAGKTGPAMLDVLNQIEPHKHVSSKVPHSHSVAAYVPKPAAQADDNAVRSGLPLRSATSTFWGAALKHDATEGQRRALSTAPGLSLTVPMPALGATVFADATEFEASGLGAAHQVNGEDVESVDVAPVSVEDEDEVVILKEMGRKRKRDGRAAAITDGMASQSDEVTLLEEDDETRQQRAKAESKKAKKEARRAARLTAGASDDAALDEQPFDYSSAPSILNPPREDAGAGAAAAGRRRQVNPHAKLLDAPKGAPRNPAAKERAGRMATFRK